MSSRLARLFGVAIIGLGISVSGRAEVVSLSLVNHPDDPNFATIELAGLSREVLLAFSEGDGSSAETWKFFSTFTANTKSGDPSMLGTWAVEGEVIRFRPRFPLVAGLSYRSVFDPRELSRIVTAARSKAWVPVEVRFALPQAGDAEPPRVVAVHPSNEVLPANLLRLYIHFSQPMHAAGVADHIRLLDEEGQPIEDAFVAIPDGLWDTGGRRCTLLMHPGRVKRGVGPNIVQGPVLEPGKRYRLVVDQGIEDLAGKALAEEYVAEFVAGPDDRERPDPAAWLVHIPETMDSPLVVEFGESLDSALSLRGLRVLRQEGSREVQGNVSLGERHASWRFDPEEEWSPGGYRLEVAPDLEDLAGNTPSRLFDEAGSGSSDARSEDVILSRFWSIEPDGSESKLGGLR